MKKYFGYLMIGTMSMIMLCSCGKDKEEEDDLNTMVENFTAIIDPAGGGGMDEEMEGPYNETEEEMDQIVTEYPIAIDEYVAANYPDSNIEEVELKEDGNFEVELEDGTELLFDPDGQFLEEEMEDEEEEEDKEEEPDDEMN